MILTPEEIEEARKIFKQSGYSDEKIEELLAWVPEVGSENDPSDQVQEIDKNKEKEQEKSQTIKTNAKSSEESNQNLPKESFVSNTASSERVNDISGVVSGTVSTVDTFTPNTTTYLDKVDDSILNYVNSSNNKIELDPKRFRASAADNTVSDSPTKYEYTEMAIGIVNDLRDAGMTDEEIADYLGEPLDLIKGCPGRDSIETEPETEGTQDPYFYNIPVDGKTQALSSEYTMPEMFKDTPNPLNNSDVSTLSRLDYIATYVSKGIPSNLVRTLADSMEVSNITFAAHPLHYFFDTNLETMYNALAKSRDFNGLATEVSAEFKQLKKEFETAQSYFDSWEGTAKDQYQRDNIALIMYYLERLLEQVETNLKPACNMLNKLKSSLEKLRDKEKQLFTLTGLRGDGSPYEKQTNDCLAKLIENRDATQKEYDEFTATYNSINNNPVTDDNGKLDKGYSSRLASAKKDMDNSKSKLDKLNAAIQNKEAAIEKLRTELDSMLEKIIYDISDINTLARSMESFEGYLRVDPGAAGKPNQKFDPSIFDYYAQTEYADLPYLASGADYYRLHPDEKNEEDVIYEKPYYPKINE